MFLCPGCCAAMQSDWPLECFGTGEGSGQPLLLGKNMLSHQFVSEMHWCQRQYPSKDQKRLLVLLQFKSPGGGCLESRQVTMLVWLSCRCFFCPAALACATLKPQSDASFFQNKAHCDITENFMTFKLSFQTLMRVLVYVSVCVWIYTYSEWWLLLRHGSAPRSFIHGRNAEQGQQSFMW